MVTGSQNHIPFGSLCIALWLLSYEQDKLNDFDWASIDKGFVVGGVKILVLALNGKPAQRRPDARRNQCEEVQPEGIDPRGTSCRREACSHHSLSWSRRVSSELWPQKVRRPPPRDPFYAPAGRVIHSLVSSAAERPRLLPGNREASLGHVRMYIAHHLA
ncbi:hypothetical protein AVEN_204760-1 [Araneus ventricosus]|uniref:Uncharacterized protein n=1 Tax=Araneus ventricosus TaxID=182803 RepID=A0A4Y2FVX2_ARAVE|nr:hypothetical protein AVEN_204760-1 [Araneus ventricosus]